MAAPKRFFKIRHKKSGLYSKGGSDAALSKDGSNTYKWNSNGKIWSGTGPLRIHLAMVIERGYGSMEDWEVVELELKEINSLSAIEMVSPKQLTRLLSKQHRR